MPTKKQIEAGARAFASEWGYVWEKVAGSRDCHCGDACDCIAPDGLEVTYERPSRRQCREVAAAVLTAAENVN